MNDGFTLTLKKNDLIAISNRYSYLKKEAENYNVDSSCFDCLRTYYEFDGFVQALVYVGIDPHIFDNDNTSS